MDGIGSHCVKCYKPRTEEQISHVLTHVGKLKKRIHDDGVVWWLPNATMEGMKRA